MWSHSSITSSFQAFYLSFYSIFLIMINDFQWLLLFNKTAVLLFNKTQWFHFPPQDVTVAGDKTALQGSSVFPYLNKF